MEELPSTKGLMEECRDKCWRAYCQPVEVGCRGFAARSLFKTYIWLGMKRTTTRASTDASERASRWLWIKGVIRELILLGRKSGHDPPGWVQLVRVYDVVRPETPNDPRIHH